MVPVEEITEEPVQVVVIGESDSAEATQLYQTAVAPFAFNKITLRLSGDKAVGENLPPALAETVPHFPELRSGNAFAVLCSGSTCQPPVTDAVELRRALESALKETL